eukprot:757507-Hanusia_phi.AAC.3
MEWPRTLEAERSSAGRLPRWLPGSASRDAHNTSLLTNLRRERARTRWSGGEGRGSACDTSAQICLFVIKNAVDTAGFKCPPEIPAVA